MSILGTLASVGGAITNFGQSVWADERSRSHSNAQRDWEEKMWHMQNEYNHPLQQRKRLIEAGLNPALMYQTMPQNVSQSAGGGSSAGSPSVTRIDPATLLIGAQAELLKAQARDTNLNADLKAYDLNNDRPIGTQGRILDNNGKVIQNELKAVEMKYADQYHNLRNQGLDLSNQQTQKFIGQMDERFRNEMNRMLTDINLMLSQTGVNNATEQRIKIQSAIDEYERKARSEGWSYSDNILFRQVVGAVTGTLNSFGAGDGKQIRHLGDAFKILKESITNILLKLF